jgi:Flp pilus assembly protein TadD
MKPRGNLKKKGAMRFWIGRIFLILCVTAMGCATGSYRANTDEALSHFKHGQDLERKGDFDRAMAEYRTALRLDPNHVDAHTNLGNELMRKGDVEEAIAEYRTALRLDPNHVNARSNLGIVLQKLGRKAEAREEIADTLRLVSDTPTNQNAIEQIKQPVRQLVPVM